MIEVRSLTKTFNGFKALSDLNMTVNTGSIYGLVGINGSGKTTLLKHLTGILRPDSGEVTFDGQPVFDNEEVKSKIVFIPDELFFFGTYNLHAMESFCKKVYPCWNEQRFCEMTGAFKLSPAGRLSRFSKGMQKQAAFCLAMSAMPEYLILDEPIDGLDPLVRVKLWKYVMNDVAERNMTVVVSSHNLDEIEGVCDAIGMVNGGEMKLEGDLDALREQMKPLSLREIFIRNMGGESDEI